MYSLKKNSRIEIMKKQVCMIAYTYYERDPRVRREAEALVEAGYAVEIIALRDKTQKSIGSLSGVNVFRLPISKNRGGKIIYIISYSSFLFLAFIHVSMNFLRNHYDLIHIHNMPNFLVFSALIPKLLGTPIILDIHDPMPELFGSIFSERPNSLIYKILLLEEKLSISFADKLLTVHKGMFDLLTARGVNPKKITVIHNLPDPKIFNSRKNLEGKLDCFTLVYAGTVSPRHKLDQIINAVNSLRYEMPDLRLRVVGEGPAIDELKEYSENLNISNIIEFIGIVPVDEVPKYLLQSNVAIASYADDDFGNLVFPTKAVEAIMVGLPVLCTRVDAVLSYLGEEVLFYYSPDSINSIIDQIRLIRNNPELVKQKKIHGERFLKQFSWDMEKLTYTNLVKKLTSKEKRYEYEPKSN